jgi:beta-lactamase class A
VIGRHVLSLFAAALFGALSAPALSQSPAPPPVQASPALQLRIGGLVAILNGGGDYNNYFAPAFLAQVPKDKFDALRAQITAAAGSAVSIGKVTPATPNSASLTVNYERGVASVRISVEAAAPNRVDGLLITGISAREASVGAVIDTLKGLPGTTSFSFAQLEPGGPRLINSLNPDQPLAIGSAFKLVILSELVRATNAGERHWSDLVTLDGSPLPGGNYTQLPAGTKVSLEELATKMISVSDNSATDILLRELGRSKIEAMITPVGIRAAKGMQPFMSTLEMFKLKGIDKGALAQRYLALDEAGRRLMLEKDVDAAPIASIDPALFKNGKPLLADRLEWFASTSDLARVMDWLRVNTEKNPNARAILSRNSGIGPEAAGRWQYVGYKGGSEPGVINMTLLLQSKAGKWYVLSGTWNDPNAAVEDGRFVGLMSRAAELAAN